MRWFCLILCCLSLTASISWSAEDDKDDSKKTPEEKLRDEAVKLLNAGDKRESLRGRFQLAPEVADQPYPKVVGIISDKAGAYQVMILDKEIKERLKIVNNKEITLLGRLMVKESGNYIITDEVYEANSVGPKAKKKRGGL